MKKVKLPIVKLICLSIFFVFIFIGGDCDEYALDAPEAKPIVSPLVVNVGDTVKCGYGRSRGIYHSWDLEIPLNSQSFLDNPSAASTFFIPDIVGTYIVRFTSSGDGVSFRQTIDYADPITVTAVDAEIKAVAGPDQTVVLGDTVYLDGSASIGTQLSYFWLLVSTTVAIDNPSAAITFFVPSEAKTYVAVLRVTDINGLVDRDTVRITVNSAATGDPWTPITDYPGIGNTYLTGISDGTFGYVGLGSTNLSDVTKDFWKFDPSGNSGSGSWSQLSNFPGDHTWDCVSFILNGKIYVGLGASTNPIPSSKKFYVYDTNSNSWDNGNTVEQFPGEPRIGASSFVLNGEAYVGFGYKNSFPAQLFDDLYKYNPSSNSWDTLNTFPGGARFTQISFVLNGITYMGYGVQTLSSPYKDFWSYIPDNWTSIGALQPLSASDFFYSSIGVATSTKGYLIGGSVQSTDNGKQVWEFDPSTGWQRKTSAPDQFLYSNDGFVIGNKVFCGAGNKKWYRYDPSLE
jgi:N-acetylneuraminic acid mutarotase